MAKTITFIRHAETSANRELRWQGATDGEISEHGEHQLQRLAGRFSESEPATLIASDLHRTMRTASMIGTPQPDARWREFDVGRWEGLTSEDVNDRYPGEMEAMFRGENVAPGGGELMSDFHGRIVDAFNNLVADTADGDDAVVVTHGGVIWAVASHVLGSEARFTTLIPSHNTAISRVRIEDNGDMQLEVFNDAVHLDSVPTQYGPTGTTLTIFRHGQTEGNLGGRWQGRSDSPLTEHGRWQVGETARVAPPADALFTSPLGRARESSEIIGTAKSKVAVVHDGLIEMSFGDWENRTFSEVAESDGELVEAIYDRGEDMPRGGTGETFGSAGERFAATVGEIVESGDAEAIGIVSHGAVIRAYITGLLGIDFADRNRLPVPRNSSMARVVYNGEAVALAAYNVAPHLD